ncbi:hypothetical protein [Liberibacter crescens]|uniref:hypothetical protein n=1 Tax=Liberibacter crescens TaxID=1273132 RepID=UPI00155E79B5|nr:hypothetical protein [Liberibacter crescens]
MSKKENKKTSDKISTLAAKVLSGSIKPTQKQSKQLAGSALSQDTTKGPNKPKGHSN